MKDIRHADDGGEVANRRVFFDFTFSPPKSVSIAALVGNDERIVAAYLRQPQTASEMAWADESGRRMIEDEPW